METREKKPFLLVGTFRNEKIKNEIHLSGREVISKNLTSSPKNWDEIINFLEKKSDEISCVILSLSESVLLIAQCPSYREKYRKILGILEHLPHIIFLYEDNLFGKFNIFNQRYYAKYLFYDDFFDNREKFDRLSREYDYYCNDLREEIVNEYFFNTIVPATFVAEEEEWKNLWNNRAAMGFGEELCIQLSLFGDEDLYDHSAFSSFIESLRGEMALTEDERKKFAKLNNQQKLSFINNRFIELREKYERQGRRSSDELTETDYEIIKKIEKLIKSPQFEESVNDNDNWSQKEWELFQYYLKEKRYSQDEKISKACETISAYIEELHEKKLNVCSYKYTNDIVRCIREYLENEDKNIVFRSYILKDRIWANELESFLQLFQDYITQLRGINISFEQRRTDIGTIYVIQSTDSDLVKSEFNQYVSDFDFFLTNCDRNIGEARETLISLNCSEEAVDYYLQKFQKGARRLRIDIRQEYERKMMQLRHSIENEALDGQTSQEFQLPTQMMVPSIVVQNLNYLKAEGPQQQIIFGTYTYNKTDEQLLEYVRTLSDNQADLETELRILKDAKASSTERTSAFEKLKKFLSDHAGEIGSIAFKLLKSYLESML